MKLAPYYWWRTVFFLIPAVTLYTVVLGTASLFSTFFDRTGDAGHQCARAWAWLILKTTGVRVRATGLEHLDPSRSYVIAANHQSIYDIPIIFTTLPLQLRIVAKESLGRVPFLGWHLQRTGHLLVDRTNPGAGILKRMATLIQSARSLIVFPEGTRSAQLDSSAFREALARYPAARERSAARGGSICSARVRARRSQSVAHTTAPGRICNRPHAFGIECRASTPYVLTD